MVHLINRWFVFVLLMGLAATPASARDKSRRVAPSINPGQWFVDGDYPADAKRAKQQGRVVVKASVNAQGRVTSCDVTTSSDSASLDALTCRLVIARGRFLPELDQAGNPVPSSYPISTRWVLRDPDPVPLGKPWRAAALLSIDPSGKITACKEEVAGSLPPNFGSLCSVAAQMPPTFAVMARGGTTPGNVIVTLEMSYGLDDEPGPAMAYDADSRMIVSLRAVHADVDIAGKASGCRVLAQSGPGDPEPCSRQIGPFLPIAAPRGITLKTAISRATGG